MNILSLEVGQPVLLQVNIPLTCVVLCGVVLCWAVVDYLLLGYTCMHAFMLHVVALSDTVSVYMIVYMFSCCL